MPLDDDGPASGPFSLINGLPVHPLVLHAAVVFIPLTAIGVIVMALIPKFGAKFGWLVAGSGAVALVAAFVTKESGEQLEKIVGEPGFDHAEWGDRIPIVAAALFVMTLILWFVQRWQYNKENRSGLLLFLFGAAGVLVAAASMYMVYMAGDTGAKSVWLGEIAADEAPTPEVTPTAAATAAATASPVPTSTTTVYTAADVAAHNSSGDCWTSINGVVYNVTDWEDKHPGGAQRIMQLCGIDGTSLFDGQHEGEPKPEQILAGYEIGVLK